MLVQFAFEHLFNTFFKQAVEKRLELFLVFKLFEEILWDW